MTSGIILLQREHAAFKAGYGLIKQDLQELSGQISLLHFKEKEYLNALKYNKRKHSYLLGRIASKQALSKITAQKPGSVFIDSGIFQFPVAKYVRDLNVQLSISHCEAIGIALAFPEVHPLGIDIEKINEEKTATIESQMTTKEKVMTSGMDLPVDTAYTMLWTIKEGLSKILKTGLMTDFKFFEVDTLKPNGNRYESTYTHHGQYKAMSCLSGSYVCTIVLPKNTTADLDEFRASLHQVTAAY